MSIEIIPAGASAVVTKKDHREERGHNGHNFDDGDVQTMRDVKDARHDVIVSQKEDSKDTIRDIKDTRFDLNQSNNERFIKLNDTVVQSASASALSGAHTVEIAQNGFGQAAVASTTGFAATQLSMAYVQKELAEKLCVGFDAVNDSVQDASKENMLLQYQISSAAVRDACENQSKTMIAFKDVELAQEKLSKEGQLQTATLSALQDRLAANAAQTAERIAAQASKEAAMCCCETQATIVAEGVSTRALINDIERDRLRDGKARAEMALSAYFAAKVAPVVPVV
jgi:hypothetical protein